MYVIVICIYIALLIAAHYVVDILYGLGIKSRTILGIAFISVLFTGLKIATAILDLIFFRK